MFVASNVDIDADLVRTLSSRQPADDVSSERRMSSNRPQWPPTSHRPHEGPGPVQALAQAYLRTHARAQSEHIYTQQQHQQQQQPHHSARLALDQGHPVGVRPGSAGHATPASDADELSARLARLGHGSATGGRLNATAYPLPSPPSPIKPLPALPLARTPSQHRHQQQNQLPYVAHRPASSFSSLQNIAERPAPHPVPSGPTAVNGNLPMSSFREPSRPGYPLPYVPHSDPRASLGPMGLAQRQPLPSPPVLFSDTRANMPPSVYFTPPRQPPHPSTQHQPVTARVEAPSQNLPPRLSPSRPERVGQNTYFSSATSPGRFHPVPTQVGYSQPIRFQQAPVQIASPSTSASTSRPVPRPERPQSSVSASEGLVSTAGGNASPSRKGLRDALPPPLPGQCWGIKRDGTRCTRKVGKGGKDKASSSTPTATPKKGAVARPTRSAGSSPANVPGVQRKKTGASRGRPIILFDSEDENDDDDWVGHRSSRLDRARVTQPTSSRHLLAPPHAQRRHRRSRSAGNDPVTGVRANGHSSRDLRQNADAGSSSEDDDVEPLLIEPSYCFQHISEINKSPGFYLPHLSNSTAARRGDVDAYVSFAEYLCAPDGRELGVQTQASLRSVMSTPLSVADAGGHDRRSSAEDGSRMIVGTSRGYMYMYELRDFSTETEVCLKVGRTSNVFRRMGEWRGRCRRRGAGLVLVGFEPSPQTAGRHNNNNRNDRNGRTVPSALPAQGMLGGAAEVWCDGIYGSHKWERLIHLELLDFGRRLDEGPCEDCGARHREIFMIPRRGRQIRPRSEDGDAIELVRSVAQFDEPASSAASTSSTTSRARASSLASATKTTTKRSSTSFIEALNSYHDYVFQAQPAD
ncbi:unnamed protein product [Tilletia caries]|uniref:Bacteriophage T5 Orf172 DNA-binding domain-containing protein n=1 Tax=Tilletia caries TaxID=13290 RepID=A0ABN7ISA0_9BASI|nr:unnamed protein product [Tilletia caries]